MTDVDSTKKHRKIRFGLILTMLGILTLLGLGIYGASWWNSRRYYLIVETAQVRVEKGRMFPVGHMPFVASEAGLRTAYETFSLPGGFKVPRGTMTFSERVQLDQALYRILKDAIEFILNAGKARHSGLAVRYLVQLRALPGLNAVQQTKLRRLEGRVRYMEGQQQLDNALISLRKAAELFRLSAQSAGQDSTGRLRATNIDDALRILEAKASTSHAVTKTSTSTTQRVHTSTRTAP